MCNNFFEVGDRVANRRELIPFRKNGDIIPRDAAGTITTVFENVAFVEFDVLDHAVAVLLGDLNLISDNERFILTPRLVEVFDAS